MRNYDSSGNVSLFVLYVILAIAISFISVGRGAFASQDVAIRTLETQGFSDIQIVDHEWFAVSFRGCDKNDAAKFTAKATNPAGKSVEVYVCTGAFFKGGTIRVR